MPRQKGNLTLTGTINGVTYYKMKGKYYARAERNISKKRFEKGKEFVRFRENGKEFGAASRSGKLLRHAVAGLMREVKSGTAARRMVTLMMKIKNLDAVSARGKRNVGVALLQPAAKKLLKGYEFNAASKVSRVLRKQYSVDTVTGKITIANLVPKNDLAAPAGATHVTLRSGYAKVDFINGSSAIKYSNTVNLAIDGSATTVVLTPTSVPAGSGVKIYLLHIEFLQDVNGVQYMLKDGKYNAMVVAEVV